MVDEGKKLLAERFTPNGFNVGINVGSAPGQTVMHCHIHLIPRSSASPQQKRCVCQNSDLDKLFMSAPKPPLAFLRV